MSVPPWQTLVSAGDCALVLVGAPSGIDVWDAASGRRLRQVPLPGTARRFESLSRGRVVVFASSGAGVVWDARSGERLLSLGPHAAHASGAASGFVRVDRSPGSDVVAACGADRFGSHILEWAVVWDTAADRVLYRRARRVVDRGWAVPFCRVALRPTRSMFHALA